jgi:hypothetical protein
VQARFEKNVTFQYQEKIFVQTDRNVYITGETSWLSIYCLDAALHTPSTLSKVVSLELISSDGAVYLQERVELQGSFGQGQLFISPEIPSGSYMLRAYTNWMRNFSPDFVFQKRLTIVNPSAPPLPTKNGPTDSLKIDFFPEGGNLIHGLESKVAVRVTDGRNSGVPITGIIEDQYGMEVAEFRTSFLGYGSFQFIPETDKIYKTTVTRNNKSLIYTLPPAKPEGVVMSLTGIGSQNLQVKIASAGNTTESIYVLVHTRGIINQLKKITLSTTNIVSLNSEMLGEGTSHITVLNDDFVPVAERLFFKYPDRRSRLDISTSSQEYGIREKVEISIDNSQPMIEEGLGKISLSVYRRNNIAVPEHNIVNNLLLTSDIRGPLQQPGYYFNARNEDRSAQLDLIMLTHGWRRFIWADVLEDKPKQFPYPAELNAPILSGRILNDMLATESIQTSFYGRTSVVNSISLKANGEFQFEVPFRVKNGEVLLTIGQDTLQDRDVVLYSPFDFSNTCFFTSELNFVPKMKRYFETLSRNIQISQVYRSYNFINGAEVDDGSTAMHFYGAADFVYQLDDYTRFETMQDLFIEYIAFIYIKKHGKQNEFHVAGDFIIPGKALVMIDGVPIEDFDFVMAFDPLKIEQVEIVRSNYYIGDRSYSGLINFTTYGGDFAGAQIPQNILKRAYHALQSEREFYAPDYLEDNDRLSRIPDYRSTLYWNPNVGINENGDMVVEFYTADDIGDYQIEVNGITKAGTPLYGTKQFKVSSH